MAFSQDDVDGLKTTIASGIQQVRYADGRQVTYRPQAELERGLSMVKAEAAPPANPSRSFVAST